ncbi:MAG: hypothetical protein WED05_03150 [Candidatus Atabeyarchaeum deiterrae]
MELTLEKIMLTLVGLSFASMICIPLIENGFTQISDQYGYSQFQSLTSTIDSGIFMVLNGTGQQTYQGDVYVPQHVTINSSIIDHGVWYHFNSGSIDTTVFREYPIGVAISFNYMPGWYRVRIVMENSSLITVSFFFP